MDATLEHIEEYLEDVKTAIRAGRYRIELNENRQDNRNLFLDYIIGSKKREQILLSLTAMD